MQQKQQHLSHAYQQKLGTAEQAAALVQSGNTVFMGEFAQNVEAVDAALALRKNDLRDVILVTTTRAKPLKCVEADPMGESFIWNDWHFSGLGRKMGERGGDGSADRLRLRHGKRCQGGYRRKGRARHPDGSSDRIERGDNRGGALRSYRVICCETKGKIRKSHLPYTIAYSR